MKNNSQNPEVREPSLEEIGILFADIERLGIEPKLVESAKLTAIALAIPRLSIVAEKGKQLLSSYMSIDEIPMSPTELGKKIAKRLGLKAPLSPQRINEALSEAGLQSKPQKTWELTEAGKKYGKLQMNTAKGHNKTVYCIRWFSSVIPVIESRFAAE